MERDLAGLSRRLLPLQKRLGERGFSEILIGGSAAVGILDSVWHGDELNLRDLDVYLIFGRKMEKSDAVALAAWLTLPELGALDEAGVTTHVRTNPALGLPERFQYLAGWGMNFVKGASILDLTVYHSADEILLNGIFTSDMIKVRLGAESLEELARTQLATGTLPDLMARGVIRDEHGGYLAWRQKQPKILHWQEIERDPAVQSLRVVRGLLRYGMDRVPSEIARPFQDLARQGKEYDRARWATGLARLQEGASASTALAMVREIGFGWVLEADGVSS